MIPALISAAVAFVIFAFTQWGLHRREQSKLLLQKLEELYMLLLEVGERNGQRFDTFVTQISPDTVAIRAEPPLTLSEWFGIDLGQKLELYVSFYFPQLHNDLERLYKANRGMNAIYMRKDTGTLRYSEIQEASSAVGEMVGAMQKRILAERTLLTKNPISEIGALYERLSFGFNERA
jgi:hypothetical protein